MTKYTGLLTVKCVFGLSRDKIVATLDEQIEKNPSSIASQIAATIYCYEKNYEAALRALHQDDTLER